MDAISNVVKRNVVAQHLKEVIDVLEQKVCGRPFSLEHLRLTKLYPWQGDQIASLYDLLSFQDKPVDEGLAGRDTTEA